MKHRAQVFAGVVGLTGVMFLAGCGDGNDEDAVGPLTSLFGGGAPTTSTTSYLSSSPDRSSTTLDEAGRRCRVDTRTLQTAQEAYAAAQGDYASSEEELVAARYLSAPSPLHDIERVPTGSQAGPPSTFNLIITDPQCGTPGHQVGQTPFDY